MSNNVDLSLLEKLVRKVDNGGGPPHDNDMETRLTALETRLDTVLPTLATKSDLGATNVSIESIKVSIESVKSEIHKATGETHKWMIATVIGLFVGFGGLFLAMSNALKPAAPAPQQAPIIIQAPAQSPAAAPTTK